MTSQRAEILAPLQLSIKFYAVTPCLHRNVLPPTAEPPSAKSALKLRASGPRTGRNLPRPRLIPQNHEIITKYESLRIRRTVDFALGPLIRTTSVLGPYQSPTPWTLQRHIGVRTHESDRLKGALQNVAFLHPPRRGFDHFTTTGLQKDKRASHKHHTAG